MLTAWPAAGFPIRTFPVHSLMTASRDFSQPSTSFIGSICLGIHFVPLSTFLCIDWSGSWIFNSLKFKLNHPSILHLVENDITTIYQWTRHRPDSSASSTDIISSSYDWTKLLIYCAGYLTKIMRYYERIHDTHTAPGRMHIRTLASAVSISKDS